MADLNRLAHRLVKEATEPRQKPSVAQTNGRKGGLNGGKSRAEKLSPEKRSEIAKKGAAARWGSSS
jgi:general stress protein YciG